MSATGTLEALGPYAAYKDSGVPWLGEVPEHWEVRRVKTLCSRSALYGANVAATSYTATGVRFLRTTDITEDGQLRPGGVFLPEELVHEYLLTDGDLLISRSGTIGRSFLYDSQLHGPCAYAGYLVRFVPASAVLPRYIFLYTKTQAFAGFLRVMAISSTIENVNGEKYANAALPLPSLPEQAAIVRFLDHADRRIRRYIRAKQKLVKLLDEQRQVIIHRAVTRGFDPKVRLKSSGVEWLGDVPEHWEVLPLARLLKERKEKNNPIKTTDILSLSLATGVIPYADKKPGGNKAKSDLSAYMLAYPGDIVLNSMNVVVGSVGLSRYFGAVSPVYYMLRPRSGKDVVEYFDAIFRDTAFQRSLFGLGNGILFIESKTSGKLNTIRLRIPMSRLKRVLLPYPGPEEQSTIVDELAKASESANNAIERAQREIDLLRELRSRLITDVVTGKLDVREAAAQLPDEAEEPEEFPLADELSNTDEEAEPTSEGLVEEEVVA